jgi:oxalate decarboxylase/phosphoglucose isomerase-like protein (cupin superfamily)
MEQSIIQQIDIPGTKDERGMTVIPMEESKLFGGKYCNVHIPSINPGAIRGNHYHADQPEYVLILGQDCRIVAVENATQRREELFFEEAPNKLLVFPPKVTHALKNEGKEMIYLVCFNEKDGSSDKPETTRKVILE